MTLRTVDSVVTNQALITGRVRDALSGLPTLQPPALSLAYQATPLRPARPFPLAARVYASGLFVFVGAPQTAFPRLAAGESLALSLTTTAAGYQSATHHFTLTSAQLQRQPTTITVAGVPVSATVLDAPLLVQDFALAPLPVHLAGRVVEADNREQPIANAQVRVTAPAAVGPATTDADGFFMLRDLPVALAVTVRVSHASFDALERTVPLDYRLPVNQQLFALTT